MVSGDEDGPQNEIIYVYVFISLMPATIFYIAAPFWSSVKVSAFHGGEAPFWILGTLFSRCKMP